MDKICPNIECNGYDAVCGRFGIILGDIMGYSGSSCYSCMINDLIKLQDVLYFWERILVCLKENDNGTPIMLERICGVERVISDLRKDIECVNLRLEKLKKKYPVYRGPVDQV